LKCKTSVKIEVGTTKLKQPTWIDCTQTYTVEKSIFTDKSVRVWCAGKLTDEKMLNIDEALYSGLCMKLNQALEKEDSLAERVGKMFMDGMVEGIGNFVKEHIGEYLQEENEESEKKLVENATK